MRLLTKTLPSNHNIIFCGDEHLYSPLFSQDGWDKLCELLESEYDGCRNNYMADGGDAIEAITLDDKRCDPETPKQPLPLEQIKRAIAMRKPFRKRILYMLMGNHERKLWRFGDLTQMMCDELKVDYGTYTAKMTVVDSKGRFQYKTYDTHGFKGITSTADDPKRRRTNMELILKRHLRFKAADCAVMVKHHTHKLLVCKPDSELYLTDDGARIHQNYTGWGQTENYIHPDARWYGNAGSLMKLYGKDISGYAEIAEYDPVELGFVVLVVRDQKIVRLEPYRLDL